METQFSFSVTKPQMIELSKNQTRKTIKPLLISTIVSFCLFALFLVVHFVVFKCLGAVITFLALGLFALFVLIIVKHSAPKNVDYLFKYYAVDGVVTYGYVLCETDFIVTMPAIGNVSHYKYEMVSRINEYPDCVAVMLDNNQFLPIPVNEQTARLVSTLKSVAKIKK